MKNAENRENMGAEGEKIESLNLEESRTSLSVNLVKPHLKKNMKNAENLKAREKGLNL